jgi:hypothetical protein
MTSGSVEVSPQHTSGRYFHMNSSGIKRGLATSAIAALAITGVPALASSASAAPGDSIQVAFAGPALNNGADGAVVILKTKGITSQADADNIKLIASDLSGVSGSQNNANQSASKVNATYVPDAPSNEFGGADGFAEVILRVKAFTPTVGNAVNFAVFEDEAPANQKVDAEEARAQVSLTTTGPVASLDVAPMNQTAPVGVESGKYVVTPRDSGGRATQITNPISITNEAGSVDNTGGSITADEAARGTASFTLKGSAAQLYTSKLGGDNGSSATVTLDATPAAAPIKASELDVVTAADSWKGFNGGAIPSTVQVRVDQSAIRLDIKSPSNAGKTVALGLDGLGNVTFAGKQTGSVTTVLDSNGVGSITVTPDSGTVQENDTFQVTGFDGGALTFAFKRAELKDVKADAATYISKTTGSVDITVTTVDQFGLPVAGAYVDAKRSSSDTTFGTKKVTDANGKATFTFAKENAVPGTTENVDFRAFVDQFDSTDNDGDAVDTTIKYTVDGAGENFTLVADGTTAGGSAYDPSKVTTRPLTDGTVEADPAVPANNPDYIELKVNGGTPGTTRTVSVDNGALVLLSNESQLPQGSASESTVVPVGGNQTFKIVGTKVGLTTVTVTSGGVTKTVQFTVKRDANSTGDARNVSVSGPDAATSGRIATFTAVVTDAFGNGVAGVPVSALNVQVSGPGRLQDTGAVTDATGSIPLNVRLDNDADSAVTVQVTGVPSSAYQFGAAANQQKAGATTNDAPGISASSNVATATVTDVTNLEELEQAVEDAQAAVDAAQGDLENAQANLDVAQTALAVAEERVDTLTAKKQKLRKKLNRAKKADNKQKAKTMRQRLRATKRDLGFAKDDVTVAMAEVDAAQVSVDNAQDSLEAAQAELEAAQAELDDAKANG